jgi:hypothetical protein
MQTQQRIYGREKPELQRGLEARHIELIALGALLAWAVYGGRKYAEMGGTFGSAGVYYRRAVCLFHHAFNGRNAVPRAGCRFIRRLRAPLYEPLLWLSHRLVILVYVDGGGISEITAIGVYVQFWFPDMAQWIPALIAVGLVALANLAAVRCTVKLSSGLR